MLELQLAAEQSFIVVVAEQTTVTDAILCTKHGALDYLGWPVLPTQFLEIAERTRKQKEFAASLKELHETPPEKKPELTERVIIGTSVGMVELSKQLVRLARTPELRVFLNGETGTGKEVVARMIHDLSGCRGPFQAVNCAATVESLLESDLFGHEKGSFTGAHATKKGLWEEAAHGTLFLDEITETSPTVQAKLLRVLQEGTIRRIGSTKEIKATARVIAASNRDLEQAVREGVFRRDLYYRLGQVLRLPPLRERLEDIPLLVAHFCQRAAREIVVTPEAMELLCAYEWPGNVRELESVIQQIISFSGHFVFREDVLRHINVSQAEHKNFNLPFWSAMNGLRRGEWPTINEIRNWYVTQAYLYFGKESVVARHLGMDARTVTAILEEVAVSDEMLRRITQTNKSNGLPPLPK
ncbi:MAG TPA: sigma-54 dependent transcriptional regulator [Blastocatellia bacterium]|nr:sigma-54 dependent transcriptional regulator [Blastocatellia bacterium]HMY75715.1 sigma-54 dependent transcriptional regulator [Blastocatellia bacterium]HMZ18762.1 sigma-54 dependent transcriptional regulator [Blastocatellia bacterium]